MAKPSALARAAEFDAQPPLDPGYAWTLPDAQTALSVALALSQRHRDEWGGATDVYQVAGVPGRGFAIFADQGYGAPIPIHIKTAEKMARGE